MWYLLCIWCGLSTDIFTHHIEEAKSPSLKERLTGETVEKCKPKLRRN